MNTPEYGEGRFVYVRELPGTMVRQLTHLSERDEEKNMLIILKLCLAKEDGTAMIAENEDPTGLLNGPLAPLKRCVEEAMKLNGLMPEDEGGN